MDTNLHTGGAKRLGYSLSAQRSIDEEKEQRATLIELLARVIESNEPSHGRETVSGIRGSG